MSRKLFAEDGWRPAGPLSRLFAGLLDMALYCGFCLLLSLPVGQRFEWSTLWGGVDEIARAASDPSWAAHASSVVGLWIALWWCYFVVGWGLLGATPGKWALGLRVTDYRQRCPIGASRAALRLAAFCVSSVIFEWGHLMVLVRADRRALHDILAGTRVVRRRRLAAPDRKTRGSEGIGTDDTEEGEGVKGEEVEGEG